jgi:hypothetical protein
MADTFGRSRGGDAAVVIDHGEDRLSVAALDREHRAEQAWQAASALGGIGDIRNDRLHVRVIDECTTQRCSSLIVLLRIRDGDDRFSIFRHSV